MADKSVGGLVAATRVTPTDLFVLEQSGTAKKLTGQILGNWLVSVADGHGGIKSIAKISTRGVVDTYRITLADKTTFDFTVTNGTSISSIEKTSTSGLVDKYTIQYNDGNSSYFTVTNGRKGDKGDNAYVWVKYASQEPTEDSHSMGDIPDAWVGIYSGNSATAPTDYTQYKWYKIKGEQGKTGENGDRGKSIFYSSSGTQVKEDTQFNPSLIETNGETLRIGDMIIVPAGNLFQITRLPTDAEYVIHARYLTSLMGPEGHSRLGGKRIYYTSTEPPTELTDHVYTFSIDNIDVRGDIPVDGDYIIDRNNNVFMITVIQETGFIRANWIATWFKEQSAMELPEYFDYLILRSSSPNSIKKFKLTVDDSGEMSIEEIIKIGTFTTEDTYGWGAYVGTLNFVVGMTWQQFVESAYNTQGFVIQNNQICDASGCYLFRRAGSANYDQAPENKIIDGQAYEWDN